MARVEAPHRLSNAIEAFKADLKGTVRSSGALCSLKECLKEHLSAGHFGCQEWKCDRSSLSELAHTITTEYLESAQLKYTLPVFLSETCQSQRSSHALTSHSLLEQLGISEASSFGRAFASYALSQADASIKGKEESLLSGLLRTVELLHGNAGGEERHQTAQGSQDTAAFALIRSLRMELHSSQHLCGVMLRELFCTELDHGGHGPDAPQHVTMTQRIASLQDTLLSHQKRHALTCNWVARLERAEAALLQQIERSQAAPIEGEKLLCFCADGQPRSPAGEARISGDLSPTQSRSTCPSCNEESPQHVMRTAGQQVRPLQSPSDASQLVSPQAQPPMCTESCGSQQGERLDHTRSISAARPLVPGSQPRAIIRGAHADAALPAASSTELTGRLASELAQPMAASADTSIHGNCAGAQGAERGIKTESMRARRVGNSGEPAWCGEHSGRQRSPRKAHTGQSSCSSRDSLGPYCQDAVAWQAADEERAGDHDQSMHDDQAAENMSPCSSVQHSTHTRPPSGEGSLHIARPPSESAAALLPGVSPQPGSSSPNQGWQQVTLSIKGSVGDEEQCPSWLSESLPREQLPQLPEHRSSRTAAAGCSAAEQKPSAWAGPSHSAALSPHIQHALDGRAPSAALQGASSSGSASPAADQENMASANQAQCGVSNDEEPLSDHPPSAWSEAHTALNEWEWRSNALSQAHGDRAPARAQAENNADLSSEAAQAGSQAHSNGDLSSVCQDCDGPDEDMATESKAAERHSVSPEEDELSRRMRTFLARVSENPAAATGCGSMALGSAISLQAAHGSEGMSERGDDLGSEQASEERQVSPEESLDLPGADQAQPERADHFRHRDGSEPGTGSEWDACTPAAPDTACRATFAASRSQSSMRVDAPPAQWNSPTPDTPTADFSHVSKPESAAAISRLSLSPASSMLPWDKPGMWPADGDSMHSMGSHPSMHPSTAISDAPAAARAAPSAPVAFMRQPSRLSMTITESIQQPGLPEGRISKSSPFSLRSTHDYRQHVCIPESVAAESRQHDGNKSWADVPGAIGNADPDGPKDYFVTHPETALLEHYRHDSTAAQADLRSIAHRRGSNTPWDGFAGMHREHSQLSALEPDTLGWKSGTLDDSHMTFPAQGYPAEGVCEQDPGPDCLAESAKQAMAWERPLSWTSNDSEAADAGMQHSHHWLSVHGYTDAAVHVTATLAEGRLPQSTAESEGERVKGPSPMSTSIPAYQKLADSSPRAIQHSSTPYSLSISHDKKQVRPAMDASSAPQPDAKHEWTGTPSSRTSTATDANILAASSAQIPVNVQDVALKRTMPSTWDLDI